MKRLTLSFDNGPDPACTPAVLDALGKRGLRASFFVCGRGNPLHPACTAGTDAGLELLARAKSEGHWVGNHSLTHTVEFGTTRDRRILEREVFGNEEVLGDLNEHRWFRPYMGGGELCRRTFSPEGLDVLSEGGFSVALFNCVPRDWVDPEGWPKVALRAIDAQDWTVLIVHDVAKYGSMRRLPDFLDEVARRDIEVVQEFPDACVPMRAGTLMQDVSAWTCGETPEPVHPIAAAASRALAEA